MCSAGGCLRPAPCPKTLSRNGRPTCLECLPGSGTRGGYRESHKLPPAGSLESGCLGARPLVWSAVPPRAKMENGRSAALATPPSTSSCSFLEEGVSAGFRLLIGLGLPLVGWVEAEASSCVVWGREDRQGAAEVLALCAGAGPSLLRLRFQRGPAARLGLDDRGRFHGGKGSKGGRGCSPPVTSCGAGELGPLWLRRRRGRTPKRLGSAGASWVSSVVGGPVGAEASSVVARVSSPAGVIGEMVAGLVAVPVPATR